MMTSSVAYATLGNNISIYVWEYLLE